MPEGLIAEDGGAPLVACPMHPVPEGNVLSICTRIKPE